jgi:hypothetical protein
MPARAGAQPYHVTCAGMRSRRATPVARERNPTAPHTQECVPDVQRRSRGSATLPRRMPRMCSRRATPVARERNPTASHAQECVPDAQRRVARERNPTAPHTQECVPDVQRRSRGSATLPRRMPRMCSRRATPVARERNPTAPYTQECVRDVQRRSARERNPTTPHTQECVPDVQRRSLTHSADGGDRTHTLLPVLDFESSASANSATSAFCEEKTTNPFATKRKRQRRQLATLKQMHKSRSQELEELQEFRRITGNKCLVESAGSRVEFITWKLMDHRYSPKSRLILNSCNSRLLSSTLPGSRSVPLPNKRARRSTDRHPGTEYSIPPNPHVFPHFLKPRTRSGQNEPS